MPNTGIYGGHARQDIFNVVLDVLKDIEPIFKKEHSDRPLAGYFVLLDTEDRALQFMERMTPLDEVQTFESGRNSVTFAPEKAFRLLEHPKHVSSWQSMDEKRQQYGGAIRAGKWILSFSGLPPHFDELVCIETARRLQWIAEMKYAENILSHSGNNNTVVEFLTERFIA